MPFLPRKSRPSSTENEPATTDFSDPIGPLKDKVFGVLVGAATFHEGQVLLLQRSRNEKFMPGAWSIPAGKIQPREESLEQAALRELYEEAGIKGRVLGSLGMTWFESFYYQRPLHHIQFNFIVAAESAEIALHDGSNMAYRWLSPDEIDQPPVDVDEFTRSLLVRAVGYFRESLEP
jgi:8-oxo-dGTP pyrophosphatase MutT (NUDIX family)